jgi:hypothetical protein
MASNFLHGSVENKMSEELEEVCTNKIALLSFVAPSIFPVSFC